VKPCPLIWSRDQGAMSMLGMEEGSSTLESSPH
jgi:hypothetical protein